MITLRKKVAKENNQKVGKLYDISKLKPNKFVKVLQYMSDVDIRYFPPPQPPKKSYIIHKDSNKDIETIVNENN